MTTFNYKWHRGRYRPEVVKRLPELGVWVKVSDAVALTGMARSTVAKRYLTGAWDSVVYNGLIHVKIPSADADPRRTEPVRHIPPDGH